MRKTKSKVNICVGSPWKLKGHSFIVSWWGDKEEDEEDKNVSTVW